MDNKRFSGLFRNSGQQKSEVGVFALPFQNKEAHSCKLGFVNVLKDSQLNAGMVDEVLDMLNVEKPD